MCEPRTFTIVSGRPSWLLAALLSALLLTACNGGGGDPVPTIQLALSPTSIELSRGGADVEVQVTLTRSGGADDDVTLSASGVPANVTAVFDPPVLSGGTLVSTLTLSAAQPAAEGVVNVTVTGTGGELTAQKTLSLEVVGFRVTGRVVTILDEPLSGVTLTSQGETFVTGANGTFTLSGLSVPYDLSVFDTDAEWAHVYEGLTASELLLAPPGPGLLTPMFTAAAVIGDLVGGVVPLLDNHVVYVCAEGLDAVAFGCGMVGPGEKAYAVGVSWLGGSSRQIRLHALEIAFNASGLPVAYPGYGTVELTVTDDMNVPADVDIDLGGPLASSSVHVDIDTPLTVTETVAAAQLGPNLLVKLFSVLADDTSLDVLMPVIDGVSYTFVAEAGADQFGWTSGVTGASTTVKVPAPATLTEPAAFATGVTTATTFSIGAVGGAPVTYVWTLGNTGLNVAVTTTATSHTIPDPAAFGLTLPPDAFSSWRVYVHPGPDVESGTYHVGDAFRLNRLGAFGMSQGLVGDGLLLPSADGFFTTAP